MKTISFIVPVFNEEVNVMRLYEEVTNFMKISHVNYDYEIIFTDNHSNDATFEIIKKICINDQKIKVYRFSRNFGYQKSILTGYIKARGDAAIQLDCDLQDPLVIVSEFIEKWEEGYKVVYGVRRTRKEGIIINKTREIFYWLVDFLSEEKIPRNVGDFRLVDRVILDHLCQVDDHHPYLRGIIPALGYEQIGVHYDRERRERGESKFSLRDMFKLAFDGIFSYSMIPLRLATYLGLTISVITFLSMIFYFIGKFVLGQNWPVGYASTTIIILFSLSLNAMFLGIMGEYLGRIYQQVKRRPLTIVEEKIETTKKKTESIFEDLKQLANK